MIARRPDGRCLIGRSMSMVAGLIALASGPSAVAYQAFTFDPYIQYEAGAGTTGIDSGDFDHDGDIDLALANRDTHNVSILMNNGAGVFQPAVDYAVGTTPRYVFAADFNGDTYLDLATPDYDSHTVSVLLNQQDGTFALHTQIAMFRPSWLIPHDVDLDGDQDIVVTKWDITAINPANKPTIVSILRNDGAASFTETESGFIEVLPRGGDIEDFDGDGWPDLVVTHLNRSVISLCLNDGTGSFLPVVPINVNLQPRYAVGSDVDADGDVDICVVHKESADLWILRNDGSANFMSNPADMYPLQPEPHSILATDLDLDGDPDLVVSSVGTPDLDIFENLGGGMFAGQTEASPGGASHVVAARLNGDISIDLAAASVGLGRANVHLNATPQMQIVWTSVIVPGLHDGDMRGSAWGDFDQDGDDDLYLSKWEQPNALFRNDGGDAFTDITMPVHELGGNQWSGRAVWGDSDNDGDLDLYVAQSLEGALLRNDGWAGFVDVTGGNPLLMNGRRSRGVAWGDYDADGLIDLYVAASVGNNNESRLLHNDGGNAFTDVTAISGPVGDPATGRGVAWADCDNDGDLDFYLANGSNQELGVDRRINRLFENLGDGTFADSTSGPLFSTGHSRGVAWGDYDNDGDFDLYVAAISAVGTIGDNGENHLFRNDGALVFTDVTPANLICSGSTRDCSWIDYDNDGDLDLYLVATNAPCKLFRNDGGNVWTDVATGPIAGNSGNGNSASWSDYDNDGDLDVFIAYATGTDSMLVRNDLFNGLNWMEFRLFGTVSNRSAIGAKVRVTAGGQTQLRQVESGSGYLAQHMLRVHVGLGVNEFVDSIEVEWPSGQVSMHPGLAVNQIHAIVEPCIVGIECDDCNANGVSDIADIAMQTSPDANRNNLPDDCEFNPDTNNDGVVNIQDFLAVLTAWGVCADPLNCPEDVNVDGVVGIVDFLAVLTNWG